MKKKTTRAKNAAKQLRSADQKLPFVEHFYEFKRRLTYVAVSIVGLGTAAYFVQQRIVSFLLRPAHGQNLIYTSPGGGLDFLFRVCIYTGIVFSLPVIVYQILKYLEPLLGYESVRFALGGSIISALLAGAGMAFGYYAGLPSTLHFLFHQFTTSQIHPLIAVQSYMHFVAIYMFGAALLFQVPLFMIFINRIKQLKPKTLFKQERWMILGAFALAVIMNPTPNVIDQLMLAGPMILMYQIGIGIIAIINRPHHSPKVAALIAHDEEVRAERLARLADAKIVWQQAQTIAEHPETAISDFAQQEQYNDIVPALATPAVQFAPISSEPVMSVATTSRPRKYIDGVSSRQRSARSVY